MVIDNSVGISVVSITVIRTVTIPTNILNIIITYVYMCIYICVCTTMLYYYTTMVIILITILEFYHPYSSITN